MLDFRFCRLAINGPSDNHVRVTLILLSISNVDTVVIKVIHRNGITQVQCTLLQTRKKNKAPIKTNVKLIKVYDRKYIMYRENLTNVSRQQERKKSYRPMTAD